MSESSLPDSLPPVTDSLWLRLRTTPLLDLLRGRLSGRLDIRRMVDEANLPPSLAANIYWKSRRTRARTKGQAAVARALIDRASRELVAGREPNEIALALEDPRRFAEIIYPIRYRQPLLPRLLRTTLGDLLCGRIAGRIEVRYGIGVANLPQPINDLIYTVARRTRLWRAERVDVARELAEHFHDGLDAGRTSEQLLESFGDPRQAAKLIRRAKLRGRPWIWRAWRLGWQAFGFLILVLIVVYCILLLPFALRKPLVSRNYALEVTAPQRAVAEADRAWPFYREALLSLSPTPKVREKVPEWQILGRLPGDVEEVYRDVRDVDVREARPGDLDWPLVKEWIAANRVALEKVREGARRPALGFLYGDSADGDWYQREKLDPLVMDLSANRPVVAILLPQMQNMRSLSELLTADARRALAEGDRKGFVEDVESIVGLARQVSRDVPFLVVDLISYAIFREGLVLVDEMLTQQPDFLSNEACQQLAHCIVAFNGGGDIRCRVEGERLSFHDFVQRTYSDNGHGDGTLTAEGLNPFRPAQSVSPPPLSEFFVGPLISLLTPSRVSLLKVGDELYDRFENELGQPLWKWSDQTAEHTLEKWQQSLLDSLRYRALLQYMPNFRNAAPAAEATTQVRDATLLALALELYHRRHNKWPASLEKLTPEFIPVVPPDRFTGKPINYRIVNDRPLLYSVGPDLDNDAGRAIEDPKIIWESVRQGVREEVGKFIPDGDWILWPPQLKPKTEVESTDTDGE